MAKRKYSSEISESKSSIANLPQSEAYRPWPKSGNYEDYGLDDTISGIDSQMNEDGAKMKRHIQPGKY
jgi:hypothetical protein